jgi:DNA polymerase-3 subunit gamma/tau
MSAADYRVLARKYRPSTFAELIGHDTLVRTLTNALASGRLAHAFMLTGVRGVGKTTTARIIARALNCVGADGAGGPTMNPCGVCDPCRTIAEDRHPDVIEMDAASRTGVDDMRELIEGVRYRPVSARFKIYIIDEVHMLSKSAFNALLKTLEEPPPDIKFVFATTEINKVPVTVLSRCQRYNLPRVPQATLEAHYARIAALENVEIAPEAVAHIARAADGSVRDGLSILDQAIALSYGGTITEEAVRDMLGVADRSVTYDLFEAVMAGRVGEAIDLLDGLYNAGTDPAMALQELLDITHYVTRVKVEKADTPGVVAADGHDRARARRAAASLGIAALARTWQMLLKGLAEVQTAPSPLRAAEMVLIRIAHVSDLPPPGELVKLLQASGGTIGVKTGERPGSGADTGAAGVTVPRPRAIVGGLAAQSVPLVQAARSEPSAPALAQPTDFKALMELIAAAREAILYNELALHVHLVRFEQGVIEFRPGMNAPRDLSTRLGKFLLEATGQRWMVGISREAGAPTLKEQDDARKEQLRTEVEAHPMMQAALAAFPGARIERIIEKDGPAPPPLLDVAAAPTPEASPLYEEDDPGPFVAQTDPYEPDDDGDER